MSFQLDNKNVECEVKFAHGEGHTVFALSQDGLRLVTGGIDGEARSWSLRKGDEDEEPESFDVGSAVFAVEILVRRITSSGLKTNFMRSTDLTLNSTDRMTNFTSAPNRSMRKHFNCKTEAIWDD